MGGAGRRGPPRNIPAKIRLQSRLLSMYRDEDQRDFARNLRNHCTEAEKSLWRELRAGQLGVKFRRQAAIGAYVVDFVCFQRRFIVELDGPQHLEPAAAEHDRKRTEWLRQQGFRVMRFRNQTLDEHLAGVVNEIRGALGGDSPPPQPSPRRGREPENGDEVCGEGRGGSEGAFMAARRRNKKSSPWRPQAAFCTWRAKRRS